MGINLEYAVLLGRLARAGKLAGKRSVLEFGAQDISAKPESMARLLRRLGLEHGHKQITLARDLYQVFSLSEYTCIDATGNHDAIVADLNHPLSSQGVHSRYDIVTNLGTFEHCFNQYSAFKNAHDACKVGGLMIHCYPMQGNMNHGYFNAHPRLFIELAAANSYTVVDAAFTADYKPRLYTLSLMNLKAFDTRDTMIYVVMQKNADNEFCMPFDGIFSDQNKLAGYEEKGSVQSDACTSYIKSVWTNIIRPNPEAVCLEPEDHPVLWRRALAALLARLGGLL